ncbi:hypothetical protein BU15DRAFT_87006 [Melanogaster broomeanus]|nr:hypothetical protein BU15DRAFT_87006 [Melanogaster broomeanus]
MTAIEDTAIKSRFQARVDDTESELFVAKLVLEDIAVLQASRKGKKREDAPLSDEEIAFQLQASSLDSFVGLLTDFQLASSIDGALDSDAAQIRTLCILDQAEQDDHEAALALEGGRALPPQTPAQLMMEEPIQVERSECVICGDRVVASRSLRAPCSHRYCRAVTLAAVFKFISGTLRAQFLNKSKEFTTPSTSRVYCPKPTCSTFLGGSDGSKRNLTCGECGAVVCSECKNDAHPGEDCSANQAALEVKELATSSGWQTCPGCHAIVELSQGCYHITCRCSSQFCYLCSAQWKTCDCRQWDEPHLLDDAERRVLNEFGARDAELRPEVYAQRVHHRMEELRYNHECLDHSWMFRHGSGECEQCGDFLPVFLMRCANCQTLACRRCSVNRL